MTVNTQWLAMPALQNGSLPARQSPHTTSGGQVRAEAALLREVQPGLEPPNPRQRAGASKPRASGFGGSSPGWAEMRSSESGARGGLARSQLNETTFGIRAVGAEVLFSASLRLRRTTPSGCVGPHRLYLS